MASDRILDAVGLRKRFGDREAVNDVSFHVAPGETYGLLGPNGAGKTTTISIVTGLLAADAGTVAVAGQPMTPTALAPRRDVGLVPQDLAIYPDLSARENLKFFGRLYGLSGGTLEARAAEVLDVIGLADRARDRAKTYSGGMKRRLNIGIALLHRPKLLILDEPTVGVDPQSRNAILEAVERLSGAGTAVLYTTHYMEEAERLCDRIGIIDQGRLMAEGTKGELVRGIGGRDQLTVRGTGSLEAGAAALRALPGVESAGVADGTIQAAVVNAGQVLPQALAVLTEAGLSVTAANVEEPGLEHVFLALTGKALRD